MIKPGRIVIGLGAILLASPVGAQQSETYNFLKGVKDRDVAAVQAIITDPRSNAINAREQPGGEGGLHMVVRGRDRSWLSFLLGRGARPNLQSSDGTTPLGLAAQIGWVDGAELLIARGADVNLANARGETPLILAVQARNLPMVRLLAANGGDPRRSDNVAGYSALDYARRDRRSTAILRVLEERGESQAASPDPSR